MRYFPYGKAALCILIAAVISGVWLLAHPVRQKTATLTFWIFAKNHYDACLDEVRAMIRRNPY